MEEKQEQQNDLKHYYSISEVAQLFELSLATIRYWETEFEVLKPKKNKKGDRFFTRKDMEYLKVIHHLLKEKGYTIDGAKRKMQLNPNEELGRLKAIESMKEVRDFLIKLKESI